MSFQVHLIDGTYELFRHFFAVPSRKTSNGTEIGALRGVLGSVLGMLEQGATHVAVATDQTIRSFRNDMWPGYKDGSETDPEIVSQFLPLEQGLRALGLQVWPMVEFEADDALATGAKMAAKDSRVSQVLICSPDKDLAQCVGGKIFQLDRRKNQISGVDEVRDKFGVPPSSIPDYLALVGDAADGFPGLSGWGSKSAATLLARYGSIEDIPNDASTWQVKVRSSAKLAETLSRGREKVSLFKSLATLRDNAPVSESTDALLWNGPDASFEEFCTQHELATLFKRTEKLLADRT